MVDSRAHRNPFVRNLLPLAAVLAAAACSSEDPETQNIGQGGNLANAGGPSTGGASGQGNIFGGGPNLGNGGGGGITMQCGGEEFSAEALPVDMYIMLDQSSSMGDPMAGSATSKWQGVSEAITAFVNSPAASGIGVGIQYFGLPDQCNPAAYQTPEVPIGLLPGVAGAISGSIAMHGPSTLTPTGPALLGAVNHMKTWAGQNPNRAAVVILATDGFPTVCGGSDVTGEPDLQSLSVIEGIAREAAEADPRVLTFVIGIAEGKSNANAIAAAGGTGEAFFIEAGDVRDQFLNAMLTISSTPLSCEFDVPSEVDGGTLDINQVSVRYRAATATEPEDIVKVENLGQCNMNNGNGWYFDHPTAPSKIKICSNTCKGFAAGSVQIVLGCTPPIFNPM